MVASRPLGIVSGISPRRRSRSRCRRWHEYLRERVQRSHGCCRYHLCRVSCGEGDNDDVETGKEVITMDMSLPGMQPVNEPPKVGGRGPDRRQRDPFVSRKIVRFLNEHPNTEFSSEAIAKSTNLTFRQVGQAMSRVVRQGDAVRGDIRGFWKAAVPQTAMSAARNSDSPQVPAGVAEGDVMEV